MSKVNISNNAAYVIKKINEIWDENPCKKTLQKIVYLIEEKGVNLGYEYGLHFYGPYSSQLDAVTTFLSADGVIDFDYSSGYSHIMSINDADFIVKSDSLSDSQEDVIDDLIRHFYGQTPSELELLTTAVYAYNHLDDKSPDNIIKGVQKIKGLKYSREQIQHAIKDFSYLNKKMPC
jgi:uncharacterized protein YwgA